VSSRPYRRNLSRTGLILTVALVPLFVSVDLSDVAPPIPLAVQGKAGYVAPGTTFGRAIHQFDLHASSGRLLDVEGKTLEYRADPGRILLNGQEAPKSAELAAGDEITVVNGTDTTEGTRRVVTELEGLRPGNPQYTLGTSRVLLVQVEGRISGKLVSVDYRPIGHVSEPPEVALTFDDGPWPGSTRKVLDVLERMNVKATFFIIGNLVDRYPDIVQNVIAAGMTIGDHSWDHPGPPTPLADLRPHRIQTEIAQPAELLQQRFGYTVGLFRPPSGSWNASVVRMADALGMRLVLWSVDPHDYSAGSTAAEITRSVLNSVRPGSIVLLHDGGGDRSATIKALPRIIRGIRKMGLEPAAIQP
jgi:peptidoglycan/xylan/chitin deacetylase (PgdA/CDA1 family)